MTLPRQITPAAFRPIEDEFLAFVRSWGWAAGRNDVMDPELRRALRAKGDLRANTPDLYVIPPFTQLLYVDVKAMTEMNASSPNVSIALGAVVNGLYQLEPTAFVVYHDWSWTTPTEVQVWAKAGCCRTHLEALQQRRYDNLPAKCPAAVALSRGSGDPYVLFPKGRLAAWPLDDRALYWELLDD